MLKNSKQMTNYRFFFILACMTCIFYISCEKTGYQINNSRILDEQRIVPRDINDCDECPVDYCCCGIELAGNSTVANLILCGVYDVDTPTTPCGTSSPPSPCLSISGSIKTIDLNSSDPKDMFCLPTGGSFSITNTDTEPVTIRFTCHADLTIADFVTITIGGTDTVYFDSNGTCFLTECV
jgi:hypothetical protein